MPSRISGGFFRCSDCDIPLVDQLPVDRPVTNRQPVSETDHPELVVLRTFPTVIEADLAKSALDSVGIDSMVRSDNEEGRLPVWRSVRALSSSLVVRSCHIIGS